MCHQTVFPSCFHVHFIVFPILKLTWPEKEMYLMLAEVYQFSRYEGCRCHSVNAFSFFFCLKLKLLCMHLRLHLKNSNESNPIKR